MMPAGHAPLAATMPVCDLVVVVVVGGGGFGWFWAVADGGTLFSVPNGYGRICINPARPICQGTLFWCPMATAGAV